MNTRKLKPEVQIEMLRNICKQLSECSDDWLENTAEDLLALIVHTIENQSSDDLWTTEGWKHYFGYED